MTVKKEVNSTGGVDAKGRRLLGIPACWLERAFGFAVLSLVAMVVYQAKAMQQADRAHSVRLATVEKWIAVTEGNRFTASDGLELQKQMGIILSRIPTEHPPSTWVTNVYKRDLGYLSEDLKELKATLKDITSRLAKIDEKINQHMIARDGAM